MQLASFLTHDCVAWMKESAEIINLPKSHGGLTPSRWPVVLCDACGEDTLLPFSGAWHGLKKGSGVAKKPDPPVVLIKWYDFTKWLLDRVDSFPKNQRFMFGQRVTDHAVDILELLVEATYSSRKAHLLADANRKIETLRWLLRLASDRNLFSGKQYEFSCHGLTECGRMVGGWWKQSISREATADATS